MGLPWSLSGPGQTVLPLPAAMAVRKEEERPWTITV